MPKLTIMLKTVGTSCNLDCAYCYHRASRSGHDASFAGPIDRGLLDILIPQYLAYVADTRTASIGWQGGEPTLAGLPYFRAAVGLEAASAAPGTTIGNDIQTNGTLVDAAWAGFFAEHRFLVGVSLDGPQEIHDAVRRDRDGRGTFSRVMAGIDALRRARVDTNILCVVGPHNASRASGSFDFFVGEGFTHLQLMPAMGFQAADPQAPPSYGVSPERYGAFLLELFDAWYEGGAPRVSIRLFDALVASAAGLEPGLCTHSAACDAGLVVEADGEVYPCDFYLHPRYSLGNLRDVPLRAMVEGEARAAFQRRKGSLLESCAGCGHFALCRGGCPRNATSSPGAGPGSDIFCPSYRALFDHAAARIAGLADRVRRRAVFLAALFERRSAGRPLPGRNDPCPCGSSRKVKVCCGDPVLDRSYLFRT